MAAHRIAIFSVAELIEELRTGRIRIPEFQRAWKWSQDQILGLLDSLYRGFPIGALLFWETPRPAERLVFGPHEILAPHRSDAWLLVDGQQRLTTLAGTLAHPDPSLEDAFVIFFDPRRDRFQSRPSGPAAVPDDWVPVAALFDAPSLQANIQKSSLYRLDGDLRQRVLEAGRRLREARIPVSIIESGDREAAFESFVRLNRAGTPLSADEVFRSIAGAMEKIEGMEDLDDHVADLGMGKGELTSQVLMQCVAAVAGIEATRQLDDPGCKDSLSQALEATSSALRSALVFLERDARIPHLKLLPHPLPLIVLCRFFHLCPEPQPRSRTLLTRWVWRHLLTPHLESQDVKALGDSVRAVREQAEERSVQRLLDLVPRLPPAESWWLGEPFDGRSAGSRIVGLWLASLEPRHFETGAKIEVKRLLDELGAESFQLWTERGVQEERPAAADYLFHPPGFRKETLVEKARSPAGEAARVLASHGFSEAAAEALRQGRWTEARNHRQAALLSGLDRLGSRLAAWGKNDRPSIAYLLRLGSGESSAA